MLQVPAGAEHERSIVQKGVGLIGSDHRLATAVATSVLGLSLMLASVSVASAATNKGLFSSLSRSAPAATQAAGTAVTIVQDGNGASFVTSAKTVAEFLAQLNIVPRAEDSVSPALDTPLSEGMRIDYRPAIAVSLIVGREWRNVVTTSSDVGSLLAAQGVALGQYDQVQPGPNAPIDSGSVVRVTRETAWTVHSRHHIPAGVVHRYDPQLAPGTTKTIAGYPGLMELTTRFVQRDDEALAERIVGVRIIRQPRARLVLRGIGEYAAFATIAERGFDATLRLAGSALRMVATAYTAGCGGCSGITASGRVAGHGVVAVDPRIIPLGSQLFIPGYGRAVAGDTGSAIRGNRIDLGFNSLRDALLFGRRAITVYRHAMSARPEEPHPRALLAARGIRPKKRLGQHFLTDASAARRIAALCVAGRSGLTVEIGPGTGALTAALVEAGASVTAIEIDPAMVDILQGRPDLAAATVIAADALEFDYDAVTSDDWCACGNLPYNIATPLLIKWLTLKRPPQRIVVMLQRDVADRLTARPGSPAYGSLTVVVALRMRARRAFLLEPRAFYPRPRVDSAVVELVAHPQPPVAVGDERFLLQVVRAAFAYRRKTIANSLALALSIPRVQTQECLASLGYNPEIRAEQLDLGAFAALAGALAG